MEGSSKRLGRRGQHEEDQPESDSQAPDHANDRLGLCGHRQLLKRARLPQEHPREERIALGSHSLVSNHAIRRNPCWFVASLRLRVVLLLWQVHGAMG
jgi:hypothetical protein